MKRILITGASGFVGRALTSHLRDSGYDVIRSDRDATESSDYIAAELADPRSVDDLVRGLESVDGVVHLAAMTFIPEAMANPAGVMDINLKGTMYLVDAFSKHAPDTRLVFVSTSEVYGPPVKIPVDEQHPINPQNPYAISKAAADQYCAYAAKSGALDIVRVRPFNHSGAGQADTFVLSSFARQIVAIELGQQPDEMHVGNLEAARDFTHVNDMVRAYERVLNLGETGAVYNVCSGESVSIQQALDAMLERSSAQVRVIVDPERFRPVDVPEVRGDFSAFHAKTGWTPERNWHDILDDLLGYWRERLGGETAS